MEALSIVKQLNTENTLHDELSYSKFLGENKLARIETFLDKQNITSLTEASKLPASHLFFIFTMIRLYQRTKDAHIHPLLKLQSDAFMNHKKHQCCSRM